MEKLKFYDVKSKKKFSTDKYAIKKKKNKRTGVTMKFAVANAPSGIKAWRVMGKA